MDNIEFLSVQEAARSLGLSEKTVRNYIKAGTLKAYKLGTSWRIKPADLNLFIETKSNINQLEEKENG